LRDRIQQQQFIRLLLPESQAVIVQFIVWIGAMVEECQKCRIFQQIAARVSK
jgi:hypothetical protein